MPTLLKRTLFALLAAALLTAAAAVACIEWWQHRRLAERSARSLVAQTAKGPVEYASLGSGPAVLVIHGGFGGHDQGAMFIPGLTNAGFRVIAPSRPGYLRTPLSSGATCEQQADALAALLDSLNVHHAAVVGISAGGPVALHFALRHPARTDALVLACAITKRTAPHLPNEGALSRLALHCAPLADFGSWRSDRSTRAHPRGAVAYAFKMCSLAAPDARRRLVDGVMADPEQLARFRQLADSTVPLGARLAGLRNDYAQLTTLAEIPFEKIAAPTLVLHGTLDRAVGLDHARLVASRLPHATLCALEGGDHLLMLGPASGRAASAVTDFLRARLLVSFAVDEAQIIEQQAVDACLSHIRSCQLPDGAFAQVPPRAKDPTAPVWIAPYFGHIAALALLAGGDEDDRERVSRWLDWCAQHQTPDGCWSDVEGRAAASRDTGRIDAWDSSAALFLLVAERHRLAGGACAPQAVGAARRALECLARLADADGLTWAKPDYRVKYLMDNVEVCAGLRAAARYFAAQGDAERAAQAHRQAERVGAGLRAFWRPDQNLFATALLADGAYASGLEHPYPQGLAQLYGLAFVEPHAAGWQALTRALRPETEPNAACVSPWWLAAASRQRAPDLPAWRERVAREVKALPPETTYLHRYALTALSLLDGAMWLVAD